MQHYLATPGHGLVKVLMNPLGVLPFPLLALSIAGFGECSYEGSLSWLF